MHLSFHVPFRKPVIGSASSKVVRLQGRAKDRCVLLPTQVRANFVESLACDPGAILAGELAIPFVLG